MEVTKKVPSLRFPGFEGDWEEKKLGEVVQNKIKGNTPDYENPKNLLLNNDFMENQAIPIYVGNDIDVKANDLLILWDGSQAGKVYTGFEGVLGSTFTAINFGSDASHLFIYNALSHNLSTIQRVWREGSGIPHVAKDFIKNYKIQLPSLPEQQKIADCLTAMDDTIEAQQQKVEQLQSYKKGLLQQLFSQTLRFPGFEGEWEEKKLGDIGDTYTGLNGKTKEDFGHGDGMFVTYMNVFSNTFSSTEQLDRVEISNDEKQNTLKKGDILFTTSSETPHEVGMSSCWNHDLENVYLNSFCFGYRLNKKEDFSPEFIAYNLRNPKTRKKISILAQGSTRFNLSKTELMKMTVGFPSLSEQQKIADCLSTLDDVIELETQKLEQLRQYKKGLLQQLFV